MTVKSGLCNYLSRKLAFNLHLGLVFEKTGILLWDECRVFPGLLCIWRSSLHNMGVRWTLWYHFTWGVTTYVQSQVQPVRRVEREKQKKMRFILCGYSGRRDKEIQENPQVCVWVPKMRFRLNRGQGCSYLSSQSAGVAPPTTATLTDPAFSGLQLHLSGGLTAIRAP